MRELKNNVKGYSCHNKSRWATCFGNLYDAFCLIVKKLANIYLFTFLMWLFLYTFFFQQRFSCKQIFRSMYKSSLYYVLQLTSNFKKILYIFFNNSGTDIILDLSLTTYVNTNFTVNLLLLCVRYENLCSNIFWLLTFIHLCILFTW